MIPKSDHWGPFVPDLDPAEYRARLRSLRAITNLLTGPRGDTLARHLRAAENDDEALPPALGALDRLAPLDRRRILSSFAGLSRPEARPSPRAAVLHLHQDDARRPHLRRHVDRHRLAA